MAEERAPSQGGARLLGEQNQKQIIENANNGVGNFRYCHNNECEEKIALKLNASKLGGWLKCSST